MVYILKRLGTEREMDSLRVSFGCTHVLVSRPFENTLNGKPFTKKDLFGKWSLIYFGSTDFPDMSQRTGKYERCGNGA
jgi:cytochrome oxidase Cu insertion factor (SCO1/SenC/PrrC family)